MSAPYNVLVLCTRNSARSILAECILNRIGEGKFVAFSAGSNPKGTVHPEALRLLQGSGYDTSGLRSKSWEEFAGPGAPRLDFVITVCDDAAGELCPVWPGRPVQAHWGVPDPAAVEGPDDVVAVAFAEAYRTLNDMIGLFARLPVEKLDSIAMKQRMDQIGDSRHALA